MSGDEGNINDALGTGPTVSSQESAAKRSLPRLSDRLTQNGRRPDFPWRDPAGRAGRSRSRFDSRRPCSEERALPAWFIRKDRNANTEPNRIYHLPVLPQSVKPQVKCYDRLHLLCWRGLRESRGGVRRALSDDRCGASWNAPPPTVMMCSRLEWLQLTGDYAACVHAGRAGSRLRARWIGDIYEWGLCWGLSK